MRQVKILVPDSQEGRAYEALLPEIFSNLKKSRNVIAQHVVIESAGKIVAGASLVHFNNLNQDPDIVEHWSVQDLEDCTRIMRLWAAGTSTVPQLLWAIKQQIPAHHFIYGIISMALQYARENAEILSGHENRLSPLFSLQDCQWDNADFATSEGERLIAIYRQLNARFLGPVACCPSEKTVRAVMGSYLAKTELPRFWERYEKVD